MAQISFYINLAPDYGIVESTLTDRIKQILTGFSRWRLKASAIIVEECYVK